MRDAVAFVLFVAGSAAVLGGLFMVWPPVSLIVAGCLSVRLGVQVVSSED